MLYDYILCCSMECKWMRPLEFASSLFFGLFWTLATLKGFGNQCVVFLWWATCFVKLPWILSKLGRITQWITHASGFAYHKRLHILSLQHLFCIRFVPVLVQYWSHHLTISHQKFLGIVDSSNLYSQVQFLLVASNKQRTQHRPTLPFHSEEFHGIGSGTLMG